MACREAQPEPDGTEIRNLMKAIGEMKMTQYRQEGVNNLTVSDLRPSAGSGKPSGECSGGTLSRVLRNYECELENRIGMAWSRAAGA
ncbi:hypothetical protein AB6G67_23115 [Enterobacter hormaechei]|uniref:hypothetical protein n=1 Tax=Enterobacter hormaechei TaxID=158836 RepID=UPI0034DCECEA